MLPGQVIEQFPFETLALQVVVRIAASETGAITVVHEEYVETAVGPIVEP